MRDGIVYIAEESIGDLFHWAGTWSAHWEADDGETFVDGPSGVSAQEAIAWGRENADVVLIRPGDGVHHSAGRVAAPPDDDDDEAPLPVWPEGQELAPRWAAGREYYGRSGDASPIDWCAVVDGRVMTVRATTIDEARRALSALITSRSQTEPLATSYEPVFSDPVPADRWAELGDQ